jgi:benzaldehyde dehydrogenase (NAD)
MDSARWSGRIWIGGEWREGRDGERPLVSPATGEQLGTIGYASAEDVDEAVSIATKAQKDWATTPFDERASILRRAGNMFLEHVEDIKDWLAAESGSARFKGARESGLGAAECYEAAALAGMPFGDVLRTNEPRLSFTRRLPVGVVGVIAPFNAPIILSINSVAPALALGNAVILKPDYRTSVSGGVTLATVFEAAGLPKGLLQVLPGRGSVVGEAMITHPGIPVISFTGSTAVGRRVGALAAEHLKRIHLELGGNNAMIVMSDVDIEGAVSVAAAGSFVHAGQLCVATGRHIVHESIADEYAARLVAHAEALTIGDPAGPDPVMLGPIIDAKQRDSIHRIVTATVEVGGKLLTGGTYEGNFYRPTVIDHVTPKHAAFREEIFGPVAPITRFSTLEEAAALASDSEYGLSLAILTPNLSNALALSALIPSGMIHVNDQTAVDEPQAPFGGVRASGTGARHGSHAANLEAFTEIQWMTLRSDLARYPF